jgi:hypothetical protein
MSVIDDIESGRLIVVLDPEPYYKNEFPEETAELLRLAKIGQAALEVANECAELPCGYGIHQGIDDSCINDRCNWLTFCKLRKEMEDQP